MPLILDIMENPHENGIIKVIGVGRVGFQVLQHLLEDGFIGVDYIGAVNDQQLINQCPANKCLRIDIEQIKSHQSHCHDSSDYHQHTLASEVNVAITSEIQRCDMLHIVVDLTQVIDVEITLMIVKIAKQLRILTTLFTNWPVNIESRTKINLAQRHSQQLLPYVDAVIKISLNDLIGLFPKKSLSSVIVMAMADALYCSYLQVIQPGLIGVDYADIRVILSKMGMGVCAFGESCGEDRAHLAATIAVNKISQQIKDTFKINRVLCNISAAEDISIEEFHAIEALVQTICSDDATIVAGSSIISDLEDTMHVRIIVNDSSAHVIIDDDLHLPVTQYMPVYQSIQLSEELIDLSPDGSLLINFNPHFDSKLRYQPWSKGFQLERRTVNGWQPELFDPNISLITTINSKQSDVLQGCLPCFVADIPDAVMQQIIRFDYLQTTLLQLLSRFPQATELFQHTPLLLWLIAEKVNCDCWSSDAIEILLNQSAKKILGHLWGQSYSAQIKFLRKIYYAHDVLSVREFDLIQQALSKPNYIARLNHCNQITIKILKILERFPQLLGSSLLPSLVNEPFQHINETMDLWQDSLRMARMLNIDNAEKVLCECKTLRHIETLHHRWIIKLNRQTILVDQGGQIFPQPPIPSTEDIMPIICQFDLQAEGRLMHHCVASLKYQIERGDCYIYRVLSPERGTLKISGEGAQIKISEFKLAYNKNPSQQSWKVVRSWIADYKQQLS